MFPWETSWERAILHDILRSQGRRHTLSTMERTPPPPDDPARPSRDFQRDTAEFHGRMQRLASLEMMRTPAKWPRHPFLCLRNDRVIENGFPKLGLLCDPAQAPDRQHLRHTVFFVNLHEIPMFGGSLSQEEFFARDHATYGSFEEMLDDGWVVD
jgi:hypothetical protein